MIISAEIRIVNHCGIKRVFEEAAEITVLKLHELASEDFRYLGEPRFLTVTAGKHAIVYGYMIAENNDDFLWNIFEQDVQRKVHPLFC